MDMRYLAGQGCGIAATLCCLCLPLFRKKWQMLVANGIANVFFVLNIFLLEGFSSAAILNTVAVAQTILALWYNAHNRPVTAVENAVFLIIYVACGSMGFKKAIDILPIIGTVLNMATTFQRDERKSRVLILITAATYCTYFVIIGSTSALAEFSAIVTTLIAMYRYRQARPQKEAAK